MPNRRFRANDDSILLDIDDPENYDRSRDA
jgi:hypothetical protein